MRSFLTVLGSRWLCEFRVISDIWLVYGLRLRCDICGLCRVLSNIRVLCDFGLLNESWLVFEVFLVIGDGRVLASGGRDRVMIIRDYSRREEKNRRTTERKRY